MGVRRAIVRTGIVLAPGAGALAIMTPIFKLGPGAPIGSAGGLVGKGEQWMSWIHVDDIVGIFRLSIDNEGASGPLNGTAPDPVQNSEFAKTFSSVLKKPYTPWRFYLPFGPPDGLLRLALGEVSTVITTGQRVLPAKPLALGYRFKYPQLAEALRAVFTPAPAPPRITDSEICLGQLGHHDLSEGHAEQKASAEGRGEHRDQAGQGHVGPAFREPSRRLEPPGIAGPDRDHRTGGGRSQRRHRLAGGYGIGNGRTECDHRLGGGGRPGRFGPEQAL
jgi:hypothetical protein